MPVVPERKNAIVLARDFRNDFTSRTGIADFDNDSKSDALISVFVDQMLDLRDETIGSFNANQINSAVGDQLDAIGQNMGLPRYFETYASTSSSEQNVAMYVDSGNFGALNGGADIILPAGTIISSDANANELGAVISYQTTKTFTLSAGSAIQFLTVQAVASSSLSNVGESVLRNHSFTNYVAGTGLKVINFYPILNGRNRETDRNYRFRLARRYDTLSTSNEVKLHLQALKVPGVLDTKIVPGYYGIGTAAVVVLGPENESTETLVNGVQAHVARLAGPGTAVTAVGATAVSLDIEMEVKSTVALTVAQKQVFESQVRKAVRNHLRSGGIGFTLDVYALAKRVQRETDTTIRLTAAGDVSDIFKTLYVRKGPSNDVSTERDLLDSNYYTAKETEYMDIGTLEIAYL